MAIRTLFALCAAALVACGSEPDVAAPAPGEGKITIAGLYEVEGVTVEIASGDERRISGTVILSQEGDRYLSSYSLETLYPGPDGPLSTEVIGNGEGTVEGDLMRGTAQTQLVVAKVPGVDPGFAFAPRQVSARIVSTTLGRVLADGTISVEIESKGAASDAYTPTRTTLRGRRADTSPPASAP
jgi:hypothetical protein